MRCVLACFGSCFPFTLLQVCVFYLVLRGLDTVEDDMSIPDVCRAPPQACPA